MKLLKVLVASAVMGVGAVGAASAATVMASSFGENDCAGYFGGTGGTGGFDACTIFANAVTGEKIELSPVIAKYDTTGDDVVVIPGTATDKNNTDYPSIAGTEFSFVKDNAKASSGTWTYTPGAGDPSVKYWAAKAGPDFKLFWMVDDSDTSATCNATNSGQANYNLDCLLKAVALTTGSWSTPSDKGLSHITFYNSVPPSLVPLPAAGWMLIAGLGGMAALRRRRK